MKTTTNLGKDKASLKGTGYNAERAVIMLKERYNGISITSVGYIYTGDILLSFRYLVFSCFEWLVYFLL